MTTKSKHKPVTLAKAATDFVAASLPTEEVAHQAQNDVAVGIESKNITKTAKASKHKVAEQKVDASGVQQSNDLIAVYRTLAERSLEQARSAFVKARDDAHTISGKLEESSSAIADGASAVQTYVVNAMQAQANDFFGYFRALADVKTVSDVISLQSSQSRKSLDSSLRQFKELSFLVNEMAVKDATPIRSVLPTQQSR